MAKVKTPKPGAELKPNLVTKFEFQTIPRSAIELADYNPRIMDDAAAEKLRLVLEDEHVGLVDAPVWNKRTGRLVGGHQRVAQMDVIHAEQYGQGEDYAVPVHVIDVDEATEKKINVILNNPAIAGDWDIAKLDVLFRTEIDPFEVGFEVMDLSTIFPTNSVIDFINKWVPDQDVDPTLPGAPDAASVQQTADEIAKIKEARSDHRSASGEALRSDHALVVVFDNTAQLNRCMAVLQLADNFVMWDRFFASVAKHGVEAMRNLTTEEVPNAAGDDAEAVRQPVGLSSDRMLQATEVSGEVGDERGEGRRAV